MYIYYSGSIVKGVSISRRYPGILREWVSDVECLYGAFPRNIWKRL